MTKPSQFQDTTPDKKPEIDKREVARQQHTNHFTNRAPVDKSESSSDSK